MNVTLYMGMSIDGLTARKNDETPWSDESWDTFNNHVNEAQLMVIGRRTYDIMFDDGSIEDIKIPICVLTNTDQDNIKVNTCPTPEAIIKYAQSNAWENVIIAGGSNTNAAFLKAKLIDQIIIDVEPIVLGKGYPLFETDLSDLEVSELPKYKLVNFRRLEDSDTVQLYYCSK